MDLRKDKNNGYNRGPTSIINLDKTIVYFCISDPNFQRRRCKSHVTSLFTAAIWSNKHDSIN